MLPRFLRPGAGANGHHPNHKWVVRTNNDRARTLSTSEIRKKVFSGELHPHATASRWFDLVHRRAIEVAFGDDKGDIWYLRGRTTEGPVTEDQLRVELSYGLVTPDTLARRAGDSWLPVRSLIRIVDVCVQCGLCGAEALIGAYDTTYRCTACCSSIALTRCPSCGRGQHVNVGHDGAIVCPLCQRPAKHSEWLVNRIPALRSSIRVSHVGRTPDSERRVIVGVVLASSGIPNVGVDDWCRVTLANGRVTIEGSPNDASTEFGYHEVDEIGVSGRGLLTATSGASWMGGGFGLGGAVKGWLMAEVLNRLTTRTESRMETFVEIRASGKALRIITPYVPPETLKVWLTPVYRAINAGRHASTDVVEQLQQLSALHQSGALTDAEFEAVKARILAKV